MIRQKIEAIGLCSECRFHSVVRSGKGKQYHLCEFAEKDPTFPKYPRLPVLECNSYTSAKVAKERE